MLMENWKKMWSIKQLCIVLLLSCAMHATAQSNKQVTIQLKNASIYEVFEAIKKQTNVGFLYSNVAINSLPSKDYNFKNAALAKVVAYSLEGSNLTFEIEGNNIIIKRKKEEKRITGKVVDSSGDPLIGISIYEKGTTHGTTTDMNGEFALSANDKSNVTLIVKSLGMKTQEIEWKGLGLNIYMEDEAHAINEVVVTGFQVINKRALTSAINTVKAEDILRSDVTSIDQMLEGHIPDMMFMSGSGEVGVAPKIRIRGTSSLIGNREPLWVVDGIIVQDPVKVSPEELNDPDYINRIGNAIAGLNPQDIERLDILKDASATALYGTKAANGVIVITTKRGQVGKPQVSYNNSFTYKIRPRYTDRSIDLMNSRERIQFSRELFATHYKYPDVISPVGYEGLLMQLHNREITDAEFSTKVSELETMNTDWFKLLTEDSFSHQHTVSVNGGSESGRYYASIGYSDANDVIKNNNNERYTAALNLDINLTKWLTAAFSMNGNVSTREYYQNDIAPMHYAYKTSRTIPAYTPDGEYAYYQRNYNQSDGFRYNILNELENSSTKQDLSSLTLNANLKFKFTDWLNANAIISYTSANTNIEGYWGDKTYHMSLLRGSEFGSEPPFDSSAPQGGELTDNNTRSKSYTARFQVDANKYFGPDEKHNINGGIGYEMGSTRYNENQYTMRGYYPDRGKSFVSNIDITEFKNYGNWLSGNVPLLTDNLTNYISGYATVTYSYGRLFFMNLNGRVDGSNKFGSSSNRNFLPIWSVSGSFNFSELNGLKQLTWLDFLTLKTSYGYQGNMLDSESPVMTIRKNPMSGYYNEYTASATQNPNPDLKWEQTNSYNLGLELSLFKSRLQFEGSLYFKKTKDAFMTKTVSTINGLVSKVINGGDVDNRGYSVSITAIPIASKDWRWTLSTSFSRSVNKIKSSPDSEQYELNNFLNGSALVKGESIGTFYSYKFLGLSPVDGGPLFDDYSDRSEELLGLSKYDTYTRVLEASGTREPSMSGGLSTGLQYKNLRLNATFAYSLGGKTRLFGMYSKAASSTMNADEIRPENNVSRDYLGRWQYPGDESRTSIPAIISPSNAAYFNYSGHYSVVTDNIQTIANNYWEMYDYSNHRVVSSNYMKCSNISFTYELPQHLLSRSGLTRLALTLSGNNLFTISDKDLKGQTPTQGGFSTIQLSDRPNFSFGLSITY